VTRPVTPRASRPVTRRAAPVLAATAALAALALASCSPQVARPATTGAATITTPAAGATGTAGVTTADPGAPTAGGPSATGSQTVDPSASGGAGASPGAGVSPGSGVSPSATGTAADPTSAPGTGTPLPGMPPVLDAHDVYAADRPGALSPVVRGYPSIVYVPNSGGDTVTELDPVSGKVLRTLVTGREPQHVVPSWDLKTLWVNNDLANTLTALDPRTGLPLRTVAVHDPYNLYFTPDGRYAVVMASADRQIVFRDAHTMAVHKAVPAGCDGVNHADFSTDGRYFLVSCEFSGQVLKVDTASERVVARLRLPRPSMPQDVKMAPDGSRFFIADMNHDGVWVLDGASFRVTGFLHTGKGAHGLYVTRDSKRLLVTNRGEGSISEVSFATGRVVRRIVFPGGGSPDMGGLSADGTRFWVSGRYDDVVYEVSLVTGELLRRIKVGAAPHGLCVFPQPGRYSLGHTGVFR